jgi:hypothetical protein
MPKGFFSAAFNDQSAEEQKKTVQEVSAHFKKLQQNVDSLTEDEILQTVIDSYTQTPSYCERFKKRS